MYILEDKQSIKAFQERREFEILWKQNNFYVVSPVGPSQKMKAFGVAFQWGEDTQF